MSRRSTGHEVFGGAFFGGTQGSAPGLTPHRIRNQGVPHSVDGSEVATWNPSGVSSTARALPTGPSRPRGFPSRAMSTTPAFPTRTCACRENSISKSLPPASILPASSLPSAHAQNQLGADARTELECTRRPVEACEGAFRCVGAGAAATARRSTAKPKSPLRVDSMPPQLDWPLQDRPESPGPRELRTGFS
jgi:hypothetical protein